MTGLEILATVTALMKATTPLIASLKALRGAGDPSLPAEVDQLIARFDALRTDLLDTNAQWFRDHGLDPDTGQPLDPPDTPI